MSIDFLQKTIPSRINTCKKQCESSPQSRNCSHTVTLNLGRWSEARILRCFLKNLPLSIFRTPCDKIHKYCIFASISTWKHLNSWALCRVLWWLCSVLFTSHCSHCDHLSNGYFFAFFYLFCFTDSFCSAFRSIHYW